MIEGEIKKNGQCHLLRNLKIIGEVRFKSMKKGKEDTQQVKKGEEFGVVLSPAIDFEVGDVLVSYRQPQTGKWKTITILLRSKNPCPLLIT